MKRKETDTPADVTDEGSSDGKKLKVFFDVRKFSKDNWKTLMDLMSNHADEMEIKELRKLYAGQDESGVIVVGDDEDEKEKGKEKTDEYEDDEEEENEESTALDPKRLFGARACLQSARNSATEAEFQMDRVKEKLGKFSSALSALSHTRENNGKALRLIERYGGHDGDHHKQWVIDQVARSLMDDREDVYEAWVRSMTCIVHSDGETEEDAYEWSVGIAP